MSNDRAGGRPSPLNVSMDMESMEREMRNIYEELKQGEGGGKDIEDLDASSLLKSRSATQMLAQIMGDLGPMLKDPMMQNHPLLAKYLEEEKEKQGPAQAKTTASGVNKKNENEDQRAKEKDGGRGSEIEASPTTEGGEREVEVNQLIHLFVSGKKEKEKVISVDKPRESHDEDEPSPTTTAAPSASPSTCEAKAPSAALVEKRDEKKQQDDPIGSPGRTARVTRESVRKDTPPRKTRNPAVDKEMERIRRAVEEKKAQRQREIMGTSQDTPTRRAKPEGSLRDSGGDTSTTTKTKADAADHSAQGLAASPRTPSMASSSGATPTAAALRFQEMPLAAPLPSPTNETVTVPAPAKPEPQQPEPPQPQPPPQQQQSTVSGPVQLGTLPLMRQISMKVVSMPAPVMMVPVPVPVPMPMPVPVEEDLPEENRTGAGEEDGKEPTEKEKICPATSPRSVTFGPGKAAILVKQERKHQDKKSESESESDKSEEEKENGERQPEKENEKEKEKEKEKEERVGRSKADTVNAIWKRAAAPTEKVKADHRKSLLDRRITLKVATLKQGSLKSAKASAGDVAPAEEHAGEERHRKMEEKHERAHNEEEEEVEESEEEDEPGKEEEEEEDDDSEYEDGGSDDEESKKPPEKGSSGAGGSGGEQPGKKSGKPLSTSSGEVALGSHASALSALVNSPRPSPSTPARRDDQAANAQQHKDEAKRRAAATTTTAAPAGDESAGGLKFSRFGSASLVSAKRTYKLSEGNNTLGRGDVQIVLKAASVSRKHATITLKNGTAFIRDLNSTHGTRVNDKVVTGKAPLAVGDSIKLGSIRLSFQVEAPIMEGVLSKRSPAFHKSWQKRYCVVKKRQRDIIKLYYYRSKENRLPQGSVSMEQVVSVTDDENGGSANVFKIKTIMRVFEFQAKDEEERNMWMKALREASGKMAHRLDADRKERQRAVVAGDPDSPFGSARSADDASSGNDEERTTPDVDRRKQTSMLPTDVADVLRKGGKEGALSLSSSSSSGEEEGKAKDGTVKDQAT